MSTPPTFLFHFPHRTLSPTLQLPLLPGLTIEEWPATLLNSVQGLYGQKTLRRSKHTSRTAFQHFKDFGLQVSLEFLKAVSIWPHLAFLLLKNVLIPRIADIQHNMAKWRHPMGLAPSFQGSYENVVAANSALRNTLQFWKNFSDRRRVSGRNLSLYHLHWSTKSNSVSLATGTRIQLSQISDFREVYVHCGAFISCTRAVWTNTLLIVIFISASGCIEITQDDQGIPLGTRVHHRLELGVERFLHGEFTYPSDTAVQCHARMPTAYIS